MNWSQSLIFSLFLILILLFEGFGLPQSRNIVPYLIISAPLILFLRSFQEKEKVEIPKKLSLVFFAFLLASAASAINAANVQKSLEYFLFYLAVALIFVHVQNNREKIAKIMPNIIFFASFSFCIYFLLLKITAIPQLAPQSGYQFVASKFGTHNHLGDFLLLPLTLILYHALNSKLSLKYILSFIFLFPFFLASSSRSAYLALAAISILLLAFSAKKLLKTNFAAKSTIAALFLIITSIFMFLATTQGFVSFNFLGGELKQKAFHANRPIYLNQAFSSFFESPAFGIGPGNFYYASIKYVQAPTEWTETVHNIFLEMLVENGALAALAFAAVIILIFQKSKTALLPTLALVLLINFQTDYTYRIFSNLLLFFIILGLFYRENETIKLNGKIFILPLFLLFLFSALTLSSELIEQKNPRLAHLLNPLNKEVYPKLIESDITSGQKMQFLNRYLSVFKGDPDTLHYAAQNYESQNDSKKALEYYQKTYFASPFYDLSLVPKIYNLKLELEDEQRANAFAKDFFQKEAVQKDKLFTTDDMRPELMKICFRAYQSVCPHQL